METPNEPARLIERLAHFLATSAVIDPNDWPALIERASTIMAVLKDPDAAMVAAGDGDIWRAMVDAALVDKWNIPGAMDVEHHAPAGTDEEGDIRLSRAATRSSDAASWVNGKS